MNSFLFRMEPQFEKDEAKLRKENAKLAHKLWTLIFDIAKHHFRAWESPKLSKAPCPVAGRAGLMKNTA